MADNKEFVELNDSDLEEVSGGVNKSNNRVNANRNRSHNRADGANRSNNRADGANRSNNRNSNRVLK